MIKFGLSGFVYMPNNVNFRLLLKHPIEVQFVILSGSIFHICGPRMVIDLSRRTVLNGGIENIEFTAIK